MEPELTIVDARLPVDDLLLATVPEPHDAWLRQLHLAGEVQAGGRIFRGEDDDIDFDLGLQVNAVTATPFDGRLTVDQIGGELQLTRDSVTLKNIAGRYQDAAISADGHIVWPHKVLRGTVALAGKNLPIDRPLLDLFPAEDATGPACRLV